MARDLSPEAVNLLFDAHPEVEELTAVRTCHRVELLVLDREGDPMEWRCSLPGASEHWKVYHGVGAVAHLHRVGAGLESLARGEREVREQIPRALSRLRSRHPRPVLGELIRATIAMTRTLDAPRSTRRSIAAIASARVLDEVAVPFPRVVVVGTGAVGRQVAEALGPYARVTLVYRTAPPADAFLRSTGARAAPLEDLAEELRHADAVVAAAKSGERVLGIAELSGRSEPLVAVDLGLPRNVDPAVEQLSCVRLVNLEGLYAEQATHRATPDLEAPVEEAARQTWSRIEPWLFQPWIDQLMRDAEVLRQAEVDRAQAYLGPLTPEQREAVERLTRRLTEKLLRSPIAHLKEISPDEQQDAIRAAALALWSGRPSARP